MQINSAKFLKSSTNLSQLPKESLPEFAFIGRSNVGKSSLINMLTGRKALAKISSKPGKTQLLNHFVIDEGWYLVDMPGYGYSKVSKVQKQKWGQMIEEYLLQRRNLVCVFVLIDSRIPPQTIDYDFIEWLGSNEIPLALIFTKSDKLSNNKLSASLKEHKNKMQQQWEELPISFISSSESGKGKSEILNFINECIQEFNT